MIKETLAQVFSCEFCEIFKNTFLQNDTGGCFWQYVSIFHVDYFAVETTTMKHPDQRAKIELWCKQQIYQ